MNDSDPLSHQQRRARRPSGSSPLKRSSKAIFGGVAAGIAHFVGANPHNIRWLFIIALLFTFGIFGLVYVALWILLPKT